MMDYFASSPIVVYLSLAPDKCPAAFDVEGPAHPRVELYREPTAGQVRSMQELFLELGGEDMGAPGLTRMTVRRLALQAKSVGGDLSLYAREGLDWGDSLEEREAFFNGLVEDDVARSILAIKGSEAIEDDAKKK